MGCPETKSSCSEPGGLRRPSLCQGYYNNNWRYMLRSWSQWTLLTNCDVTNGGLAISPGINTTNAAYLWIYDGHLYGKIGTPNSQSDGTIIL